MTSIIYKTSSLILNLLSLQMPLVAQEKPRPLPQEPAIGLVEAIDKEIADGGHYLDRAILQEATVAELLAGLKHIGDKAKQSYNPDHPFLCGSIFQRLLEKDQSLAIESLRKSIEDFPRQKDNPVDDFLLGERSRYVWTMCELLAAYDLNQSLDLADDLDLTTVSKGFFVFYSRDGLFKASARSLQSPDEFDQHFAIVRKRGEARNLCVMINKLMTQDLEASQSWLLNQTFYPEELKAIESVVKSEVVPYYFSLFVRPSVREQWKAWFEIYKRTALLPNGRFIYEPNDLWADSFVRESEVNAYQFELDLFSDLVAPATIENKTVIQIMLDLRYSDRLENKMTFYKFYLNRRLGRFRQF